MKILGIETSSPVFSLCLIENGDVQYEHSKQRESEGSRDARIFEDAKRIVEEVGGENIEAIAISIGPGMFTSLRVGLSLAKGLSMVYGTPLVAVNTLDSIGIQPSCVTSPVVAVINAFRGEVYAAFYEQGKRTSDYLLKKPSELLNMIEGDALVIGPGVEILKDSTSIRNGLDINGDERYNPSASKVVALALPRVKQRDFDDIEFLEPFYIKKTDAERNYDKGNAD